MLIESSVFIRDTEAPVITAVSSINALADDLIGAGEVAESSDLVSVSATGQSSLSYLVSQGALSSCFTDSLSHAGHCSNPSAVTDPSIPRAIDIGVNANDYFICVKAVDTAGNTRCSASPVFERVGNQTPVISDIAALTVAEDTATGAINFTITDPDGALPSCAGTTVVATSSNTALVTNAALAGSRSGTAPNCSLNFTPEANIFGVTTITVTVSDGTLSDTDTFVLTVSAAPDAPTISNIANQTVSEDTLTSLINFTIGDPDADLPSCLGTTVTVSSSNQALVSNAVLQAGRVVHLPLVRCSLLPLPTQMGQQPLRCLSATAVYLPRIPFC